MTAVAQLVSVAILTVALCVVVVLIARLVRLVERVERRLSTPPDNTELRKGGDALG